MSQLLCDMPDVTLSRPHGLSSSMFFKVYSGPNTIAFAQLSSRSPSGRTRHGDGAVDDEQQAPGVSFCLKNIEVQQNYRNKGIGSALLDEIIDFCRDERVTSIYGEARGEIDILRRWYQGKGFELDQVDNIQLSIA